MVREVVDIQLELFEKHAAKKQLWPVAAAQAFELIYHTRS